MIDQSLLNKILNNKNPNNALSYWINFPEKAKPVFLCLTPKQEVFLNQFKPWSEPRLSEINSLFTFQIENQLLLNTSSYWIIRDGVLGLTLFFNKNPRPSPFLETTFYLPYHLIQFVPTSWRPYFGAYNFESLKNRMNNKLIVTACISELFLNKFHLKKCFQYLHNKNKFDSIEIFFITRLNKSDRTFETFHASQYLFLLDQLKKMKTLLRVVDFKSLAQKLKQGGYYFIDLSDQTLFSYHYIHHLANLGGNTVLSPFAVENQTPSSSKVMSISSQSKLKLWTPKKIKVSRNKKQIEKELSDFLKFQNFWTDTIKKKVDSDEPWSEVYLKWGNPIVKKGLPYKKT